MLVTIGLLIAAVSLATTAPPVGRDSMRCAPISYAVDAAAPPVLLTELRIAIAELRRVSGLTFVEQQAHEDPRLAVRWVTGGVSSVDEGPSAPGYARLGTARAQWRAQTQGWEFVSGVIEVDGSRAWMRGLSEHDALAAVLLHELGHVLRLSHSSDPSSFMHPVAAESPPRWTPSDLADLAHTSREAGCGPPTRGHHAADRGMITMNDEGEVGA